MEENDSELYYVLHDHSLTWVSARVVHSRKTPHPGLDLGNGDLRNFAGRGSAQPEWTKVFWAEQVKVPAVRGSRQVRRI